MLMPEISSRQTPGKAAPLVTVAMPIYNAGKHLRQAVMSIVRQTFTDWELLIIDDGSTDNAIEAIADIQDARVRILCDGKNKGLAARLNEAIDLARGRYLARMDQDDVSYPERFMWQVAELEASSQLDLVATRAITIDENDNATGMFPYRLSHNEICARPWMGFYLPHPTWMGRIEWFGAHRYAEPAPYFCEDQELLLRSYGTSRFATLDKILFAYRVRGKTNWGKLARTRRTVRDIQILYFLQTRQWHFMLFSVLVFAGRMSKDWLVLVMPGLIKVFNTINPGFLLEWRTVVKSLGDGA
jgi:glycosyltransferase involved in cell wall biosynthesis